MYIILTPPAREWVNARRDLCSPIPDVPLVRVRRSLGVLSDARYAAAYHRSRR